MANKLTILSWSSGKDSAWALHILRQQKNVNVCALQTTFNQVMDRVAMHAVRRQLVKQQARAAGLPLIQIELPWPCSNEDYERAMGQGLTDAAKRYGATQVAFGDLFLEDIRAYREERVQELGLTPIFPLWKRPTADLAAEMIYGGLEAHITCVDPTQVSGDIAGRKFDFELLSSLPVTVDPCGENGEFHTFTSDGPMFSSPIPVTLGQIVHRDGFIFADLEASAH